MNYWFDGFNGTTWKEFRDKGARVCGFRERFRKAANRIKPGDVLLCYLYYVMRWVGALEVVGPSSDCSRIYKMEEFPVRLDVRPLILLDPEHGIPKKELEGVFRGSMQSSLCLIKQPSDGQRIQQRLETASSQPVARPVDPKKLAYVPSLEV